jgi:hypothetical protein
MKPLKQTSLRVLVTLAFGALVVAQGCGDDANDNPKPNPTVPIDQGGKGGKGNNEGGTGNTGNTGNASNGGSPEGGTGNTGNTGNAGPVGGEGGGTGIPPLECGDLPATGADGCFNCPEEPNEFLNRCVDGADCEPFDNAARLPLLEADGSLPPLPN